MKGFFTLLTLFALVHGHTPVLLKNVRVLTMHKDRLTTARRGAPVQQMECVGGTCSTPHHPQVIQCYNQGTDDKGEVQWACKAELHKTCHLGTTTVSCEGFTSPEDDYVLAGSCGVEYTIHCLQAPSTPVTTTKPVQPEALAIFLILTGIVMTVIVVTMCCTTSSSVDMHPIRPAYHHHYATRSRTRVVEVEDDPEPVVVHRRRRAPVVVESYDSGPGFWTGYAMGSSSSHHHHHYSSSPTTHSTPVTSHYQSSTPVKEPETHVSTGYGGTKKR